MNNTTKGSKVRPTLRVDPKTAQRVEQWYKAANCRSQNEFMERAINFYADYIEMNDNNDLLPQALQSYLDGRLDQLENRMSSLLYKQAVTLDTGMSVLVDCVHLDEVYLRKKRAESAARVKKLNGHLQLEQMAKRAQEQRDSDDGWQD